jgi:hypothetical protein
MKKTSHLLSPFVLARVVPLAIAATLVAAATPAPRVRAADTLPEQLSDSAFWTLIEDWSEPGGIFQSENFVSNESGFQVVIPRLMESIRPGSVYLGVGPEQNFTYIAAIRPKISFIIDIRRQNMIEHLLYKALFELSASRVDFLSRLLSRKRPSGLGEEATADELFNAYRVMPADDEAFARNLQQVKDTLLKRHAFRLTVDDEQALEHVYTVFRDFGPDLNYNSGRRGRGMPTYADLMTATDRQGEKRSYLATEEHYRTVRDLELRNAIVPLTGDFGGTKTLRAVGEYLTRHSATVSTFYLSNVERYLFWSGPNENGGWERFYENVAALPIDASSTLVRSVSGARGGAFGMRLPNVLASIQETLAAVKDHRIQTYDDVFTFSR